MKIKLIILISVILLVSAACTMPGGSSGGKAQANVMEINFLTSQPPTELYEDQQFRVGLNVKNYDTKQKDVMICVYDTLSDYFSGIPADDCRPTKIEAAEISGDNILPFDERVYYPSRDEFYTYENIEKDMSSIIFADIYYKHKTKASANICLKRDLETQTGVNCEATSKETVENSNGPVQVSNLVKTIYPMDNNKIKLILKFDVSNTGSGKVSTREAARSKENIESFVTVKIDLAGITDEFKCAETTKGKFELKLNQKTIKCEADINIEQEYIVNPVEITLDYEYTTQISSSSIKLIKIEKGGK